MTAHALLSPSGASRWLACTPSARLEATFPDKGSEAADEGTLAHALAELVILGKLKYATKATLKKDSDKIKEHRLYDGAMLEHVEQYAVFVMERFADAGQRSNDPQIFLEQRLDLTDYAPESFGTGDVIIIAEGVLDLIDLKYGKGVPVSAVENKQMLLYALGALKEFDWMYDIETVRMTIYQPRLDNFSTWDISVPDLKAWAENFLKPKALAAFNGDGEYVPGDHCRFCKAKAVCKANADKNLEIVQYEFRQGGLLRDDEVADILNQADTIKQWLSAVEEMALAASVNEGKKWPGWKLVEGRSNRQYSDQQAISDRLIEEGFTEEMIFKPKALIGITEMEKAIGKKIFAEHLGDLVIKPPGKPTLVPESDKRPEYNSQESAVADFNT